MPATGRKREPIDPMILLKAKIDVIEAQQGMVEAEATVELKMKVRDEAIKRAKDMGLSLRDIAPLMGRTVQRVSQIENSMVDDLDEVLEGEAEALAASGVSA